MKFLLTLIGLLLATTLFGQNVADSLYSSGKKNAQGGEYVLAIEQLEQLLVLRPGDYDGQVLLARVLYWKGDYTKSLKLIEPALVKAPGDAETQLLYLNLLIVTNQMSALLVHLTNLPVPMQEQAAFKFAKIKALYLAEEHEEALDALNIYLVNVPEHLQARQLQQVLVRLVANQAILADIEMSSFDIPLTNWYSLA